MGKAVRESLVLAGSYLFLSFMVLVAVFPIIWIVSTSLRSTNTLMGLGLEIIPRDATLANYLTVLRRADFLMWIRNSTIFAGGTTAVSLALATTAAYAFSRFEFVGRRTGLMSLLLFQMFPAIASIIPTFLLLKQFRLLNTYLGMIILYTASALPFCIWMLKGYFDTIPRELEEAALIDGASQFQVFWRIILPLSRPMMAVTALFAFIGPWMDYIAAYAFISKGSMYTLAMGLYGMASEKYNTNWPVFAAGAVVVAVPLVVLFLSLQKYIVAGLTRGGVKG